MSEQRAPDPAWLEIKVRLDAIAAKNRISVLRSMELHDGWFVLRHAHSAAFILQFSDPAEKPRPITVALRSSLATIRRVASLVGN